MTIAGLVTHFESPVYALPPSSNRGCRCGGGNHWRCSGYDLFELFNSAWGVTTRYAVRKSLMTPPERAFLLALDRAAEGGASDGEASRCGCAHCCRGHLEGRYKRLPRMFGMHFDYVIYDPESLAPLVAVELDDKSHGRRDRRRRDAFLAAACHCAGLPLVRVPVSNRYDTQQLHSRLREAAGR